MISLTLLLISSLFASADRAKYRTTVITWDGIEHVVVSRRNADPAIAKAADEWLQWFLSRPGSGL